MSVIGPRPALWNQDVLIAEREKYHANDVKPGLTGWAQINGRDELEIPVKAKLDGEYVEKESLFFDMRNDVEKKISDSQVQKLFGVLQNYGSVTVTDTVEPTLFPFEERFVYLDKMLEFFSNSRLVVTDRIHGMIFSYLTSTPCLVFGNYNHKVESEYEWIKDCPNIYFLKSFDIDKINKKLSELYYNEHFYKQNVINHWWNRILRQRSLKPLPRY